MLLCPLHTHTSPNMTSEIVALPYLSELTVIVYVVFASAFMAGRVSTHTHRPVESVRE